MWFKKNKVKIITALLAVVVLCAAFFADDIKHGFKKTPAFETVREEQSDIDISNETQSAFNMEEAPSEGINPESEKQDEKTEAEPAVSDEPQKENSEKTEMIVDPETGKDQYMTDPVPEGKPIPVEPQDVTVGDAEYRCTISISCETILDNIDLCDKEKRDLVPEDGWILKPVEVVFHEGESVFDVLQRVCKQNKIHMEFENTPIYNSAYIEGIHNLYEFDVGELSGWMYKVNDWFPNYGCSRYQLKDGDVVCWVYTCDLGYDVGGGYAVGGS